MDYYASDPSFPPPEFRVKLDSWRAYEAGYASGVRGGTSIIPSSLKTATVLARQAWRKGFENGSNVAATPDPFPQISREERNITAKYTQPTTRKQAGLLGPRRAKDYSELFQAGFASGRSGGKRLFGSRDLLSTKAWYQGFDKGAQLAKNLKRIHR